MFQNHRCKPSHGSDYQQQTPNYPQVRITERAQNVTRRGKRMRQFSSRMENQRSIDTTLHSSILQFMGCGRLSDRQLDRIRPYLQIERAGVVIEGARSFPEVNAAVTK